MMIKLILFFLFKIVASNEIELKVIPLLNYTITKGTDTATYKLTSTKTIKVTKKGYITGTLNCYVVYHFTTPSTTDVNLKVGNKEVINLPAISTNQTVYIYYNNYYLYPILVCLNSDSTYTWYKIDYKDEDTGKYTGSITTEGLTELKDKNPENNTDYGTIERELDKIPIPQYIKFTLDELKTLSTTNNGKIQATCTELRGITTYAYPITTIKVVEKDESNPDEEYTRFKLTSESGSGYFSSIQFDYPFMLTSIDESNPILNSNTDYIYLYFKKGDSGNKPLFVYFNNDIMLKDKNGNIQDGNGSINKYKWFQILYNTCAYNADNCITGLLPIIQLKNKSPDK